MTGVNWVNKIEELKRKLNAVILAHNYQEPEVQDIADFVGDSLEMALKALETDADVIVVAGVSFMAEVVALLNPDKIVIHPDPTAKCPLADFLTPQMVEEAKRENPGRPIVLYVNTYANVKAYADYVVTSASAARLISRLEYEEVLFGPDKNLADYVAQVTGKAVRPLPPYGHCPIHEYLIDEYYLMRAKGQYPNARVLVHPEAPREVRMKADFIGSTSQMLRAIGEINANEFILGTEEGLVYRAKKLYPDKAIYPLNPKAVCLDMKKITPLKILRSLELLKPRVTIESDIVKKAREAILRSLELLK